MNDVYSACVFLNNIKKDTQKGCPYFYLLTVFALAKDFFPNSPSTSSFSAFWYFLTALSVNGQYAQSTLLFFVFCFKTDS